MQGPFIFYFKNDDRFEGTHWKGEVHGEAVFYHATGEIEDQEWYMGTLKKSSTRRL